MVVFLSIIALPIVLLSSAGRCFGQAASATSHLKKPLIYEIGNVVRINAEGERPLLRALDALQQKYGWIVDYEEPQYSADADRAEDAASSPPRRHANPRNGRPEAFSVEFTVGPTPDSTPDESSVLTTVVNAYNEGNAVVQFELRDENNSANEKDRQRERRFDVVGINERDHQNDGQSQPPILNLPINLRTEPRSAAQTILAICDRVSEKSKTSIAVGAIDGNLSGKQVAVGGSGVSARTLLSSTVTSVSERLFWRLLYDSSSKNYELSLVGLPQ
jgi:hypothetical protein